MKIPGPDHPITIAPTRHRVRVIVAGRTVADTEHALVLHERNYRPVFYIPRADVDMSVLVPSAYKTHCPYKGDAAHFSIHVMDRQTENAAWSYQQPYPAVAEIAGRIAFYPARVDSIEELAEPGRAG
jgi:uncharacterized protein (DUF427 family)